MKKVLLTSTALVAFAGAAHAEVTISGSAEMGIYGGTDTETQFFQDLDVTFTMSGETDGGLTFGASVDLDEAQDNCATTTVHDTVGCVNDAFDDVSEDGGATIFISGNFGTVTMGDTDGALDWAITDAGNIGNPGSIADDETSHAGYNGSWLDGAYDGQIVRYDNTFGDFGVAVSIEMEDTYDNERDTGYALGFSYSTDLGGADLALGLGYQVADGVTVAGMTSTEQVDVLALGATATLDSGFTGGFTYSTFSMEGDDEDLTHLGIGLGYAVDAFSVHANWGQFEYDGENISGWGLAAGYDLGGGASVLAGYGSSESMTGETTDTWSLGLSMSF